MTAQQELESEWMAKHDYLCELAAEHYDPCWDCEPDYDQSPISPIDRVNLEEDLPF